MLLREGVNPRHLIRCTRRARSYLLECAFEFASRILPTSGCRVEIRVVDGFGQEGNIEIVPSPAATCTTTTGTAPTTASEHQHEENHEARDQCVKQLFHLSPPLD